MLNDAIRLIDSGFLIWLIIAVVSLVLVIAPVIWWKKYGNTWRMRTDHTTRSRLTLLVRIFAVLFIIALLFTIISGLSKIDVI